MREVPPDVWARAKESVRIRNERYEAEQLVQSVPKQLEAMGPSLGAAFRTELLASVDALERALQANDVAAIARISGHLNERAGLLHTHRAYTEQALELQKVIGSDSPVRGEIDQTLAAAAQAIQGTSWEEVRAAGDALVFLSEHRLNPARFYNQLRRELEELGPVSPALARQFQEALAPFRNALQQGSWEAMREEAARVPAQAHYPREIQLRIARGKGHAEALQPVEAQSILAEVNATRAALAGESWELAMEHAARIEAAAEAFGYTGAGMPATPCVRVLSIDGGGIRGIIPAMILAEIEHRTGRPIFELFDVIAGTSTGGILALGLARPDAKEPWRARYRATDLVELYETQGATIFPATPLKALRGLVGPKYRPEPLEDVLREYFGETMLLEALTNVVIPVYVLDKPGHGFLSTYNDSALHVYMWEAARGTSAAPTYFPPYQMPLDPESAARFGRKGMSLIDGGVFANNPAPYVLAMVRREELRFRKKPYGPEHPLLLLSLGTGSVPSTPKFEDAWNWGLLGWARPLVNILLSDPGVEDEARDLLGFSDYYFRLQPQTDASTAQMDNADPDNITRLKALADNYLKSEEVLRKVDQLVPLLLRARPPQCERIVGPFGERLAQ